LGIQGVQTVGQSAALLETAYPGSLQRLGESIGLISPTAAAAAAPSAAAGTAALGAIPGVGAIGAEGTAGLATVVPQFGAVPAAGAGAGTASGAATASGIGGTAASTGTTASGILGSAGSLVAPAALGAGAGVIGGKLGPHLLPFGGKTAERIESGLGGAAAGAGAGFLVGGPVGAVIGGLLGGVTGGLDISVIATATFGLHSPETRLAQRYRHRFIGQHVYRGYRRFGDPLARFIVKHPWSRLPLRKLLIDPCLSAMNAELSDNPWYVRPLSRMYLRLWVATCRALGNKAVQRLQSTQSLPLEQE
jgi:hypothetical protein